MTWYFEERVMGRWCPRTTTHEPVTISSGGKTYLKMSMGLGREVRGIAKVAEKHLHLGLDIIHDIYGMEGTPHG